MERDRNGPKEETRQIILEYKKKEMRENENREPKKKGNGK